MKSPDDGMNDVVRAMAAIYIISMVVVFVAGMWVQARFG